MFSKPHKTPLALSGELPPRQRRVLTGQFSSRDAEICAQIKL
jgi:hypothetical protein